MFSQRCGIAPRGLCLRRAILRGRVRAGTERFTGKRYQHADIVIFQAVERGFAIPAAVQHAFVFQYNKVMAGHGLLGAQRPLNLAHCKLLAVFKQVNNTDAQGVSQGTQQFSHICQ